MIVCCVAPLIFLFSTQQLRRSLPRAKRRVALLYFLFVTQQDLILHLLLQKEKERYCISLMNFITTTSTSYHYSPLSETPVVTRISEKRGLCSDGLLHMEKVGMRSLLTAFENSDCYQNLRKARAMRCFSLQSSSKDGEVR
jgi:hypothetical protein